MDRIIEIYRPAEITRSRKWCIRLDGAIVGVIEDGRHYYIQTDERRHVLELARYSSHGMRAGPVAIAVEAGEDDCHVFAGESGGLWHQKLNPECRYLKSRGINDTLSTAVSQYMIWLFFRPSRLKRLIGKNNCRRALGINCGKDGVHICWETPTSGEIRIKNNEVIIPYDVTGLRVPPESLTEMDLRRMDYEVHGSLGGHAPCTRDENGCFVLKSKQA